MRTQRSIGVVVHSPRTVRVALDDRTAEAGGGELQLAWIARLLRDRGWDVSMITPLTGEDVPLGEVGGYRVIGAHAPGSRRGPVGYVTHTLPAYWRALGAADAALYLHRGANPLAGHTAAFCALHGRSPVLSAASNLDVAPHLESGEKRPSWLDRHSYAYFLRSCATVMTQSDEQASLHLQYSGRRAYVVPNAIAVPETVPPKTSHPTVTWAGAIRACKRPLWVLDIARQLPDLEFRVAGGPNPGEEPLWERLQEGAAALPNVHLLGWVSVSEVERLIGESWAALCTSQMEGFPNIYLMAWSQETPLATSFSAGGIAERSGGGALADTPDGLATALRVIAQDAGLRQMMGRRARAYTIAHHGPQVVGDRYDQILSAAAGCAAAEAPQAVPLVAGARV